MPFLSFHSRNLSGRKSCCFCSNWTSKLRARLLSFCSWRFMVRWEMVGEEMVLISPWIVEYLEPFLISNRIYINICNLKSKTNLSWLALTSRLLTNPLKETTLLDDFMLFVPDYIMAWPAALIIVCPWAWYWDVVSEN